MTAYRRVYDSRHTTPEGWLPRNRDQLRNPTLGNRVWATFTFTFTFTFLSNAASLHIRKDGPNKVVDILIYIGSINPNRAVLMHRMTNAAAPRSEMPLSKDCLNNYGQSVAVCKWIYLISMMQCFFAVSLLLVGEKPPIMTSSTKPEILNVSWLRQNWATAICNTHRNLVKFGYVVLKICLLTNWQTERHTYALISILRFARSFLGNAAMTGEPGELW